MRMATLRSMARAPAAAALAAVFTGVASAHREGASARLEAAAAASEAPSFSERMVGNYENRLRKFSSPERVFEYFSSVEIDRQFYMTRDDLARAITPYTYRSGAPLTSKNYKYNLQAINAKPAKEAVAEYRTQVKELLLDKQSVTLQDIKTLLQFRDEHNIDFETHVKVLRSLQITNAEFDQFLVLHGAPQRERTFFDLVDADGDGLISYAEYMFFNTLLTIPERQFELAFKMFDSDGNGRLDHREFRRIMDLMRLRTPAGRQDRSLREEDAPIFKHLFGELATETLSYEDFCAFRRDLKTEIMRIQFEQYDIDDNKALSPREFAMFLVSHVNQKDIGKWVDRVENLRDMSGQVTEQEFINFMTFLEHLDELKVAIDIVIQERGLDKEHFRRATRAVLRGQKEEKLITPLQIEILFALFDADGDGHLSPKEFIDVMQKRKDGGFNERRDTGAFELISRVLECIESSL